MIEAKRFIEIMSQENFLYLIDYFQKCLIIFLIIFLGWPKEALVNKPWIQYLTFILITLCGFMVPIIINCLIYVKLIFIKKRKFKNKVKIFEVQSKSHQEDNINKVEFQIGDFTEDNNSHSEANIHICMHNKVHSLIIETQIN